MIRYNSSNQLSISEFKMPFEVNLDQSNRWVILSKLVPWDYFAGHYYKNMTKEKGAPTIDARIILGAVIIKHLYKLDDRETIEMIKENPYMQYFLGLMNFSTAPVFDPSLFVIIRKRIGVEIFDKLTENLISVVMDIEKKPEQKDSQTASSNNEDSSKDTTSTKNRGKLQMDATVADADIKYPTDLDLLNDSREKSEQLIDALCKELNVKQKPRTYRKVARKEFLKVSKMKNKNQKSLHRAIRLQINYLSRNIKSVNNLLDSIKEGKVPFDKQELKYFFVIQHVLAQQNQMFKSGSNSCDDRIVSIHQPHVRPIVRGKSNRKVEFGAKINVSLQNNYARIDRISWDAFNESTDLKQQVERYKDLYGYYPELVQTDKIYLTRENRNWLKERSIRHIGSPLGRRPKQEHKTAYQKRKEKKEFAERNHIEGKFGQGKNGYNLNHIRARRSDTSISWIAAIIYIMNLIRFAKDFLFSFLNLIMVKCKAVYSNTLIGYRSNRYLVDLSKHFTFGSHFQNKYFVYFSKLYLERIALSPECF